MLETLNELHTKHDYGSNQFILLIYISHVNLKQLNNLLREKTFPRYVKTSDVFNESNVW